MEKVPSLELLHEIARKTDELRLWAEASVKLPLSNGSNWKLSSSRSENLLEELRKLKERSSNSSVPKLKPTQKTLLRLNRSPGKAWAEMTGFHSVTVLVNRTNRIISVESALLGRSSQSHRVNPSKSNK